MKSRDFSQGRGLLASTPATRWQRYGVAFVFLWFLIGGLAHFVMTDLEMRIVPPFIPWPRAVVLVSGILELLGAVGLTRRSMRRTAGLCLFMLTIAVTPAHIYMLQMPERFHVPYWALAMRIPLQIALLVLIAWSTDAFGLGRRQPAKHP